MVQVLKGSNENIQRISSREVAEMMGIRQHCDLLRKIDAINDVLGKSKIAFTQYWIESTYTDIQNKHRKEYQVSKKGCELLAHKSTGEKGVLFTIKYMERFDEMEQQLKSKPLSSMDLLKLQLKALEEQDQKIEDVKSDLKLFKYDIPLFTIECEEISKLVRKIGLITLGGKQSNAYRNISIRNKVYSDIYSQLKREFGVNSYKAIKRKNLQKALDVIGKYELPIHLEELILMHNSN